MRCLWRLLSVEFFFREYNGAMIDLFSLVKDFGGARAVDRLSFQVHAGEVFGLLGPNGAGKTTTVRMLTTLATITSGKAEIGGVNVEKDPIAVKKMIGLAPQGLNLEIELTAAENLEFHGRLHRMPREDRRQRIRELLEFSELWERRDLQVQKFSGGMKRRLLIARAIMHRPKVLFLDEPTVGLDPQIRRRIWDMVLNLKARGITILLTTHYIEEADLLCDRVAIMNRGRLVALDAPHALKKNTGVYAVVCSRPNGCRPNFFNDREEAVHYASQLEGDVTIRQTNLEDVFIAMTGEAIRD